MIELPSRLRKIALLGGATCTLYGGLVLWKDTLAGEKYEYMRAREEGRSQAGEAKDKVFVVTGANSGIGREIAHQLAREKGRVFMACRDLAKCEEERQKIVLDTRNKYVYCRKCDLADFQSVRDFVTQFNAQETKCDVLINNAGVMKCRKMQTKDGIELQLGTNHMGHFLLTHLLRPSLKTAGSARIVYLTDLDYRKGTINFSDLNSDQAYDPSTAFRQSQMANILAVQSLAQEFATDKISVSAAYPGVCGTAIRRHTQLDKSMSGSAIANPILWFFNRSAEAGAQTPLYCALDPTVGDTTGQLWSNMKRLDLDAGATDQVLMKRMTAVSKYWSGLLEATGRERKEGQEQEQEKEQEKEQEQGGTVEKHAQEAGVNSLESYQVAQ